mgnify:CR=1 FL=1
MRSTIKRGADGMIHIQQPLSERETEHHYKQPQELIDFCTNCRKKKCNGDCTDFRKFRKKFRKESKK